jgi:phytoene desaturase
MTTTSPTTTPKAIVIGGGITGLASAGLLARDGYDVVLLEKQGAVGGRAGSLEVDGFRFDTGPSWYLMPEVFDHFFKLMGTSADEQFNLVRLDPAYRVYFEGYDEPIEIVSDREASIALFESIEPGAGKKLAKYLDSAEDTYEIAKRRFLFTSFQSKLTLIRADVLKRLPKLTRLLTQSLHTFASRTVSDQRLQQVLGYPAVFLGSTPFKTPSMYHLMSHLDLSDVVYYPMGGFTKVIERIAAVAMDAGVQIRTHAEVDRILVKDGKAVGVELAGGTQLHADIVVATADLHHVETSLLEPNQQTYPDEYWQKQVAGPGALLLYLGVKGDVPALEHHTLLFAKDWKHNFDAIFGKKTKVPDIASIYICKPSGLDPEVAPEGHANLFVLVPIPADPTLTDLDAVGDRIIEQIAEWTNTPDLASRIVVRRQATPADFAHDLNIWKGSALGPAHVLKQSAFFRAGNVSKKVRGLYYAGSSSIPGIGLPMCLISAEILIKRLRGDTSTEPLPEPL